MTTVVVRPTFQPAEGSCFVADPGRRCRTCKSHAVLQVPVNSKAGEEFPFQPVCPVCPSEHKELEIVTHAEITIAGDFLPLGRCKECGAPLAVLMPARLSGRPEPVKVVCSACSSHETGVSQASAVLPDLTFEVKTD